MGCIHSVGGTNKSKRSRKKDQEDSQIEVTNDAAKENIADVNKELPPGIFKLNIDCCEELFSYLPLLDLHSLGQTCKRMRQFTGYFVRENYKSEEFQYDNGNLYFSLSQMNGFIEFISNLKIGSDQLKRFSQFAPRFKSVRKLCLILYDDKIECIKEILHKCEEIEIYFSRIALSIDLYKKILKFCSNIKYFKVNRLDSYTVLENGNWLHHEYLNLENLDLHSWSNVMVSNAAIRTFFTLNKGIRKFQTNFLCFWDCRHWIVDSDIKLDKLSIGIGCISLNGLSRERIHFLNKLYERGFYKHLSLLRVYGYDSSILAEIRAPLTMDLVYLGSPLPSLDLKELNVIRLTADIVDLETIFANNLSTIECVHVDRLKTENVLFFVGKFIKLREIKIDYLSDVNSFDLAALNEERKKLLGAKNVTIYLNKRDYNLTTKTNDCKLVTIKLLKEFYD